LCCCAVLVPLDRVWRLVGWTKISYVSIIVETT
jgi:hypothetical protein